MKAGILVTLIFIFSFTTCCAEVYTQNNMIDVTNSSDIIFIGKSCNDKKKNSPPRFFINIINNIKGAELLSQITLHSETPINSDKEYLFYASLINLNSGEKEYKNVFMVNIDNSNKKIIEHAKQFVKLTKKDITDDVRKIILLDVFSDNNEIFIYSTMEELIKIDKIQNILTDSEKKTFITRYRDQKTDVLIKLSIMKLFGKCKMKEAMPVMLETLWEMNETCLGSAIGKHMKEIDDANAFSFIRESIVKKAPKINPSVLHAIASIGDHKSLETVREILISTKDNSVVQSAIFALAKLKDKDSIEIIAKHLQGVNYRYAIWALVQIGTEDAIMKVTNYAKTNSIQNNKNYAQEMLRNPSFSPPFN